MGGAPPACEGVRRKAAIAVAARKALARAAWHDATPCPVAGHRPCVLLLFGSRIAGCRFSALKKAGWETQRERPTRHCSAAYLNQLVQMQPMARLLVRPTKPTKLSLAANSRVPSVPRGCVEGPEMAAQNSP